MAIKENTLGVEAERKAFEREMGNRNWELDRLPSGVYLIPAVRFAWEGWQARASLDLADLRKGR